MLTINISASNNLLKVLISNSQNLTSHKGLQFIHVVYVWEDNCLRQLVTVATLFYKKNFLFLNIGSEVEAGRVNESL